MTKLRYTSLLGLLALYGLLTIVGCRSAHTTSAILYIEEQQYQKAVDVIHEGFAFQDDEPDAYYYLGEAYSKLAEEAIDDNDYLGSKNYYELSYDSYMKAKELDHKNFDESADLSMQHNYTMRKNEAVREYQQGYYEQAEGFFRLAFAALPDSFSSIKNIAVMKMQHADETDSTALKRELRIEALALLDTVLAHQPEAYSLQLNKAEVLASLRRRDEAQALYNELLREHGDDPELLTAIANMSIDRGDFERAADLSVQLADIYTGATDAGNDAQIKPLQLNAGSWYALPNVQEFDKALVALDRAAELEGDFPNKDTMLLRLQTFYSYGAYLDDQARRESDPARKVSLEQQAAANYQRGVDVGNALTNLYEVADGYLFLARCQGALGDHAAAEINLKAFQELNEGSP